jgi:predicted MPP superfamily phosphohydrolase
MFDIIGDIHGHADKLVALLQKLKYQLRNGSYFHPESKAVIVGDYIDRDPKIKETLSVLKHMVDAGNFIALMGNHEYNAICFHFPEKQACHIRKHLRWIKNIRQNWKTKRTTDFLTPPYYITNAMLAFSFLVYRYRIVSINYGLPYYDMR